MMSLHKFYLEEFRDKRWSVAKHTIRTESMSSNQMRKNVLSAQGMCEGLIFSSLETMWEQWGGSQDKNKIND